MQLAMKSLWCFALSAALAGSAGHAESLTREQIQQRLASPPADFANLEAPGANLSGINFAGFVLSLATTAAVHFGDIPDPNTGQKATPNLQAAGQMIEILGMLQEKTKGNLLDPEAQLIDDLLYELRMRFVQAQEGDKRIIHP